MQIETTRLIIRTITADDSLSLFEYRSDKITNQYQGWIPQNLGEMETFISKIPLEFNLPETWFQLAIEEKNERKIIGDIGIHFFGNENLQVELGCTLNKNYHGKGYATEGLTQIIEILFSQFGKHRIIASIDPKNSASKQMLERIGFRKEAHFIKSLFLNNEWVDDVVYALLKEEWTNK